MLSDHQHSQGCGHENNTAPNSPTKEILTREDLAKFHKSLAFEKYFGFITALNDAIKNKCLTEIRDLSSKFHDSHIIKKLELLLSACSSFIDEIPAQQIGLSRFGNPAYRDWYDKVEQDLDNLLSPLLKDSMERREASTYFLASFGDRKRIDYGTGHEANFICFLLCLESFGLVTKDDYTNLVGIVFWNYILLMRKLQFVYWLEPAGSHGVWGLDDYQFLPFLFGSAQLIDHKHLRPKSIHDKEMVDEVSKDYMYFSCIQHINAIKSASLRWHSPMLDDISGVKKWAKVNEGMFKMYRNEVLNKLPIMQHFFFGAVLRFKGSNPQSVIGSELEHVHALGQEHPLCCTIRVPSSIAATQSQSPRRLPFD